MSAAGVVDLLTERRKRQELAMHFETDLEALEFACTRIDELRDLADDALLLDTETLALRLDQAAACVRACMRLHTDQEQDSQ